MSSPWQLEATSTTAVSLSLPFSPLLAFHVGCVVGGGPSAATLCVRSCAEVRRLLEKPAALPTTCSPAGSQQLLSLGASGENFLKERKREKTPPQILPKNEIWQSYPVPLYAKLSRTPFVKELWGTSGTRRKIVKFCCGRDELIFASAICPSHGSRLSSVWMVSLHGP